MIRVSSTCSRRRRWLTRGGLLALLLTACVGPVQAAAVDKVLVIKSERRLYLLHGGDVVTSYRVALGRRPVGTKLFAGDGRTPEGTYRLGGRNPASRFHRSIGISYPDPVDTARARAMGRSTGGDIMLHGLPNERPGWGEEHWMFNWTNGCIAVTNAEMNEIWRSVRDGTPIEIRP